MCKFFSSKHVMPGYICCRCKTYNGLQRKECHGCGSSRHTLDIPATVTQCKTCGFGWEGEMPVGNLAGQTFEKNSCPCCKVKL